MATYRQYTSCINPGNYADLGFSYLGWVGSITTIVTFVIVALTTGAAAAIVPALIAAMVIAISFLVWWLDGRLICLGSNQCAIGMVLGVGKPQPMTKAGDDDATMNIVLAPGPLNLEQPESAYWGGPQGKLVQPNPAVLAIGRGYVGDADHLRYLKHLHCEFEGSGIRNLLNWAQVVLALLIAMLLVPFPFNLIVLWLLSVISVFAGTSAVFHPFDPGDPTDVDKNLAELRHGQIVVVKGDWIYDSLHDGWNEIHAIHACEIVGEITDEAAGWPKNVRGMDLSTDVGVDAAILRWCDGITVAEETEGGGSRDDPANDWVIHPLVDGCKPPIIIE